MDISKLKAIREQELSKQKSFVPLIQLLGGQFVDVQLEGFEVIENYQPDESAPDFVKEWEGRAIGKLIVQTESGSKGRIERPITNAFFDTFLSLLEGGLSQGDTFRIVRETGQYGEYKAQPLA